MQRTFRIWLFLALALCVASFWLDAPTIAWVKAHHVPGIRHAAGFATKWGDFLPLIGLLAVIWIVARLARGEAWSRLLGAMIVSGIASGLAANILRAVTCRTRPNAAVPPGWYGLRLGLSLERFHFQFASFPSAHTTVAFGAMFPLLFARSRWAAPGLLVAGAIGASRIYLNDHHLSDVMAGAMLGGIVSWAVCFQSPFSRNFGIDKRIEAATVHPPAEKSFSAGP